MSRDLEAEIAARSAESGLSTCVLRAVYLREFGEGLSCSIDTALARVDGFIVYALTRDTTYALDRDLVPSAQVHSF